MNDRLKIWFDDGREVWFYLFRLARSVFAERWLAPWLRGWRFVVAVSGGRIRFGGGGGWVS
jgi:hypothetical protein